ncbi:FKBP-type peptidyl-prolyl cis-trans isomerase [anaerobic digester metagenome]
MKRWYVLFQAVLIVLLFASCNKEGEDYEAIEKIRIDAYLQVSPYNFEAQENGLYYCVLEDGTGQKPVSGDFISFSYSVRVIGSTSVFDTNIEDTAKEYNIYSKSRYYAPLFNPLLHEEFPYRRLVRGVEEGVKLMKEGERAMFIVPFSLGYGRTSYSQIPAYSTLIFDIRLDGVYTNPEDYSDQVINEYVGSNYPDLSPTDEGYYFVELLPGEGELLNDGDVIEIDYTAYFVDGPAFYTTDQSIAVEHGIYSAYNTYKPESFTIGSNNLIEGFSLAALRMREKSKARLIFPPKYAFGKYGNSLVGPYMPIIVDLSINSKNKK